MAEKPTDTGTAFHGSGGWVTTPSRPIIVDRPAEKQPDGAEGSGDPAPQGD